MKVITVANRKGGCGKSTTAAALCAGLAARDYKVLAVDLDGQSGNLTRIWAADRNGKTTADVLLGKAKLGEIIQHTGSGDIAPGGPDLNTVDVQATGKRREFRLKDAIKQAGQDYDFIVIDNPVGFGLPVINTMAAAEFVIIPTQADALCLSGLDEMGELVASMGALNPGLKIAGVLLTRFNPRLALSRELVPAFETVTTKLGTRLFNARVRESVAVKEAQAQQKSLFEYAPRCNAARDYSKFLDELLAVLEVG